MTTGSRILAVLVLLAAAGGGALYLQHRSETNAKPKAAPAARGVPVTVASVQVKEVPLTLNLVGRAEFLFFSTDGSASIIQFWKWPFAIRFSRIFNGIH